MHIHPEQNGITVITMTGRFDATVTESFKQSLNALCDAGRIRLVLDMAEVSYIDSTGLGSIISCLRRIREMKGEIKVSCLSDPIRSIFHLTRFHRIIEIFDDTAAAVSSFSTPVSTGEP